jgi:hypothetical protein
MVRDSTKHSTGTTTLSRTQGDKGDETFNLSKCHAEHVEAGFRNVMIYLFYFLPKLSLNTCIFDYKKFCCLTIAKT